MPKGSTQNVSVNSGSRAVMCPATPSLKPEAAKMRKPPARRSLRCRRSAETLVKTGGASFLKVVSYAVALVRLSSDLRTDVDSRAFMASSIPVCAASMRTDQAWTSRRALSFGVAEKSQRTAKSE